MRFVAAASSPLARHYVDVSDTFEAGLASLRAHAAYLDALGPDGRPDGFLRQAAAAAGAKAGVALALPVEVI